MPDFYKFRIKAFDSSTWLGNFNIIWLTVRARNENEAIKKAKKVIERKSYETERIEL